MPKKAVAEFTQYAYYQYTCQAADMEGLVTDNNDKPGHLARRFQQIAVAVFHAAVEEAGYDLTPVQYAALTDNRDAAGNRSGDACRIDRL